MHSVSIVLSKPEGEIAELFAAHQSAYPDIAMGSYPSFEDGRYRTELVLRGIDPARLEDARSGLARRTRRARATLEILSSERSSVSLRAATLPVARSCCCCSFARTRELTGGGCRPADDPSYKQNWS